MNPEDFYGKLVRIKPGRSFENLVGRVDLGVWKAVQNTIQHSEDIVVQFSDNIAGSFAPEDLEIVEEKI